MAEMTMVAALNKALEEEMEKDKNIFCIGEDIANIGGAYGVTKGLLQKFPRRLIDSPLCELGPASMCVGAALYGRRPVMEIMFADFMSLIYDSVVNQASKMRYLTNGRHNCPVVFRAPQGIGSGLGAHHSQTVDSWFMNAPGLKIVTPSTVEDAYGLLKAAIRDNNPVVFLEHKSLYKLTGDVSITEPIPLGKANIVREGRDITLVTNQLLLKMFMEEIDRIESELGISIEVIDPRTIKPFDYETVQNSVKKTGRLVLMSEGCYTGNWTCDVASNIAENCFEALKAPIRRFGSVDSPIPFGEREAYILPRIADVVEAMKSLCK